MQDGQEVREGPPTVWRALHPGRLRQSPLTDQGLLATFARHTVVAVELVGLQQRPRQARARVHAALRPFLTQPGGQRHAAGAPGRQRPSAQAHAWPYLRDGTAPRLKTPMHDQKIEETSHSDGLSLHSGSDSATSARRACQQYQTQRWFGSTSGFGKQCPDWSALNL